MKLKKNHRVIDIETGRKGVVTRTTKAHIFVQFETYKFRDAFDPFPEPERYEVLYVKTANRLARQYRRPPKPKRQTVVTVHPSLPFGG